MSRRPTCVSTSKSGAAIMRLPMLQIDLSAWRVDACGCYGSVAFRAALYGKR